MFAEMSVGAIICWPWEIVVCLFFGCLNQCLLLFDFLAMLQAGEFQKLVIEFLNIKHIIVINDSVDCMLLNR